MENTATAYTPEEIAKHEENGHVIGAPNQKLVLEHEDLGATKQEPIEQPKTNAAGIVE